MFGWGPAETRLVFLLTLVLAADSQNNSTTSEPITSETTASQFSTSLYATSVTTASQVSTSLHVTAERPTSEEATPGDPPPLSTTGYDLTVTDIGVDNSTPSSTSPDYNCTLSGDPGCMTCDNGICTLCKKWWVKEPFCQTYLRKVAFASDDRLTISTYNDTALSITWPVPDNITDKKYYVYKVTYVSDNGDELHITSEANSTVFGNLKYNTRYNVTVEVCRTLDNSTECNNETTISNQGKTSCRAPDNPIIDVYFDNTTNIISVNYTVVSTGCDEISQVVVVLLLNGNTSQSETYSSVSPVNFTVTGPGKYTASVKVVNNQNYSSEHETDITVTLPNSVFPDTTQPPTGPATVLLGNQDLLLIFAIAPSCILLIVLVVTCVMCVRRKKHTHRDSPDSLTEADDITSRNSVPDDSWLLRQREAQLANQNGQVMPPRAKKSASIPRAKFQQYFDDCQAKGCFSDKFKAIPVDGFGTNNAARKTINVIKNRYKNIIPYDESRVQLPLLEGVPDSDYINASFVTGHNSSKQPYIAAQGPKPETVNDFWRMVVTYKVSRIVMLTVCRENVKQLCEQYWPSELGSRSVFDTVVVKMESLEETTHFAIRSFSINHKGQRTFIRHYQMTSWQDKTKPDSPLPMMDMIQRIRATGGPGSGPLLVHCSAGVGRTGTYIALDCLLDQLADERQLDVDGVIYNLRAARPWMVQTSDQYAFIHEFLVTYLRVGDTTLNVAHLMYSSHGLDNLIEQHYKAVQEVTRHHAFDVSDSAGNLPENKRKNRLPTVVPKERFRAFLSLPVEGTNDYINATYVNSFWRKDDVIVTQVPVEDTVVDFWRLIHDHHVDVVILLENLEARGQSIPGYLPTRYDPTRVYGKLKVELTGQQTYSRNRNIILSEYSVSRPRWPNSKLTLRLYHLTNWPLGGSVPRDTTDIMDIVGILKHHTSSGSVKIVVQCLDGVSCCGLFCAAAHVLGQSHLWSDVDIPLSVLSLRERRRQFIINMDQFRFLYQLVRVSVSRNNSSLVQSFDQGSTYSNVISETAC